MNENDDNDITMKRPLRNTYSTSNRQKFNIKVLAGLSILFLSASASAIFFWGAADSKLQHCQREISKCNATSPEQTEPPISVVQYPGEWEAIAEHVLASMNRSADPCEDFYHYACGGWLESPESDIPADRSSWSRSFSVLGAQTETIEISIASSGFPLLGLFYDACMNTKTIDKLGITPLLPMLAKIEQIQSETSLTDVLSELWLDGVEPLFSFGAQADFNDPNTVVGVFDQGGLLLPVTYYNSDDANAKAAIAALSDLAFTMFRLMPAPFNQSALTSSRAVIAFQTEMANISLSNVDRRDPEKLNNVVTVERLKEITTSIDFSSFLRRINVDLPTVLINVTMQAPLFFHGLDYILGSTLNSTYLRNFIAFQYVVQNAWLLSHEFRTAIYGFTKVISGIQNLPSREKQCVRAIDQTELGFAMGHIYVAQHFSEAEKNSTQLLVAEILATFASRLHDVEWLDSVTRERALEKLKKITPKLGYPDKWPQYDAVRLYSERHFENVRTLTRYSNEIEARRVNQPTDRSLWNMIPQTVNAYYDASTNEIVFPAAIFQAPFYNIEAPYAMNYGGIGSVIGHELHHAFDDEGRRFDGDGKLAPWWETRVLVLFEQATACVARLYSNFTIILREFNQTLNLNGNLTLGENLADMGGLTIAFEAYSNKKAVDRDLYASEANVKYVFDGLSSDQLYFVATGNSCQCTRSALRA